MPHLTRSSPHPYISMYYVTLVFANRGREYLFVTTSEKRYRYPPQCDCNELEFRVSLIIQELNSVPIEVAHFYMRLVGPCRTFCEISAWSCNYLCSIKLRDRSEVQPWYCFKIYSS